MATIKDVAATTGLSIATVSKYLNGGNVLEHNRAALEKSIKRLGYRRNEMARGLKLNRTMTVGVLIPHFTAVFFTEIVSLLEDLLHTDGYATVLCNYRDSLEVFASKLQFLLNKRVDGLVVVSPARAERYLAPVLEQRVPLVTFDRRLTGLRADSVLVDNAAASRSVVCHLAAKGHRRIGIIVGPSGAYTAQGRLRGFVASMKSHGLTIDPKLIKRGDYTVESGLRCGGELSDTDVTAIYATNYEMTLGAMIALHERHIRIPSSLSVVGFDSLQLAYLNDPPLTIVDQPRRQIAESVAGTLISRMGGDWTSFPKRTELPTELHVGSSVADLTRGKE